MKHCLLKGKPAIRYARATLFLILLTFTIVLLSEDCSTFFRTRTPSIPVTSSPEPSRISVNHKPQGQTPIEIRLAKRRRGQVIRIESPGYNPLEIQVGRDTTAPNYLMDALLGVTAGGLVALAQATSKDGQNFWTELAVDAPVGATIRLLIDLIPDERNGLGSRELLVTLTKADEPPRVDSMFIDAKEFRNVKWIRVHRN